MPEMPCCHQCPYYYDCEEKNDCCPECPYYSTEGCLYSEEEEELLG
ncbi:MAG: hypothetical protein QW356_02985 [Candidatus Hadarchaeales archaeon]